ncbi:MAG: nucleotidyltransferase family protein [Holosporaceae bacterium]|jgi:hypothetical protein|nr:nucleotidyltransferase family protein [Holosporaceae bacterium]
MTPYVDFFKEQLEFRKQDIDLLQLMVADDIKTEDIIELVPKYKIHDEHLSINFMLSSLVCRCSDINHPLLPKFKGVVKYFQYGNVLLLEGFHKIGKELNRRDIPILMIKGLAMRYLYQKYPRHMYDIDFAVPKNRFDEAVKAAENLGASTTFKGLHSIDMCFGNNMKIDIHSIVVKENSSFDSKMWQQAKKVRAFGVDAFIPIPEDLIFLILINFYGSMIYDGFFWDTSKYPVSAMSISWMYDVANLVKSNNINWNIVLDNAAQTHTLHMTKILLKIFDESLPGILPQNLLTQMHMLEDPDTNIKIKRDMKIIKLFRTQNQLRQKAKSPANDKTEKLYVFQDPISNSKENDNVMNEKLKKCFPEQTLSAEKMNHHWNRLDSASCEKEKFVRHLHLGPKIVKLECYLPHIHELLDKQFAYIANEAKGHYDIAVRFWEEDVASLIKQLAIDNCYSMTYRSENDAASKIEFYKRLNVLNAYNAQTRTHYFASGDMSKNKIVDLWGEHLFVCFLNNIISDAANAVFHAAAVGINGNGVLICGRGGAGKSTLAVSALLDGFEFVSEDYLVLTKENGLHAYPMYSTSSLAPGVISKMNGLAYEFLNDNWNNTKHVIDLSAHHAGFVEKLPIKVIIFPSIAAAEKPSIEKINRSKAVVQMAHSTVSQMCSKIHPRHLKYVIHFKDDLERIRQFTCSSNTAEHMKHILSFMEGLDVYQINLSTDFKANVDVLRKFINELEESNWNNEEKICINLMKKKYFAT